MIFVWSARFILWLRVQSTIPFSYHKTSTKILLKGLEISRMISRSLKSLKLLKETPCFRFSEYKNATTFERRWNKPQPQVMEQSDSNGIWIYNHLVCKRTLNHLVNLAKWLNFHLRTKCSRYCHLNCRYQAFRYRARGSLTFRQL